jgi:hypothetical protein
MSVSRVRASGGRRRIPRVAVPPSQAAEPGFRAAVRRSPGPGGQCSLLRRRTVERLGWAQCVVQWAGALHGSGPVPGAGKLRLRKERLPPRGAGGVL